MIEKDDTITNTKKLIYSKKVIVSPPSCFRAKINWRSHLIYIDFHIVTINGEPFLNCTFSCGAPCYQLRSFFLKNCIGFSFFKLYVHKSSELKNIVLNEKLIFSEVKETIISKSSYFESETIVNIMFSKEDSDRIIDLIFDKGITRGKLHNIGISHVVIEVFLDYKET